MSKEQNDPLQRLTEQDIVEAMQAMEGYIDITPADFREIYQRAYCHALTRIRQSVLAQQIMTRSVVTAHANTPLHEVAQRMASHHISGVPVVDDQQLVGFISEKNFLRHLGTTGHQSFMEVMAECLVTQQDVMALGMEHQSAAAIMTSPVISINAHTPLQEIALIMTTNGINHLPVVNTKNALVGIVSRTDLIRATQLEEASCPTSQK